MARPRPWLMTAVLLVTAGLVAGPVGTAAGAPRVAEPSVQALLDEAVDAGFPGLVASVRSDEGVWRGAAGAAVLEPRVPMKPPARYRVGSVTKTFVATVVLQLVGEGVLRLDDTIASWLQDTGIPNADQITIRQLLNHTAGVFDYTQDPALFERDFTTYLAPTELVAIAAQHPPVFPPGESWSYSNTGYILAGLVVEEATGNTLRHELQQRIFRPLHLRQTSFPDDPPIRGYHAHGYEPAWDPTSSEPPPPDVALVDVTRWSPSWAWAAGAIVSHQRDIERFYGALLDGRLLRRYLLEQMLTWVPVSPTFSYGLGIMHMRGPCGPVVGHVGGVPGYVNVAYLAPAGDRFATVMTNLPPFSQPLDELYDLAVMTSVCQMYGAPEVTMRARSLGDEDAYAPPIDDLTAVTSAREGR